MEPRLHSVKEDISPLSSEIVSDLQRLVREEMALARTELLKGWVRGKNAAQLYVGSVVFLGLAVEFALLTFAEGLVSGGIPLGISYASVSLLLAIFAFASYQLAGWWARLITLPVRKEGGAYVSSSSR
jgi:hypothetical protein